MVEAINHFSHEEHPLLLSQVQKKTICYGCQEQILEPTAYCCFSCDFFLHKRCSELPLVITHPMHSQHPLLLLKEPPPYYTNCRCNACGRDQWKFFTYHCKSCQFDLDVSCAINIVDRRLEHEIHEHPMILQQRPATFRCNACDQKDEDSSYMCITCTFWIHKRCASLPRSVKDKNHNHSLSLTHSPPVDYRSFTQYCPVCHLKVHPSIWAYYCGPCRYFVHITCIVISQEDPEQQPWEDINNSVLFAEVQNEGGMMRPDSLYLRVGAENNSINGVHDRQIGIVGSPPAPELVKDIISIKHQQSNAELDAANQARDAVIVEQSGNEATDLRKQGCSSYTIESELGITREMLEQNSTSKLKDAAKYFGVSRSTLKRICRKYNIHRWPPRKATKGNQVFAQQETVQPFAENTEELSRLGEEHSRLGATRLQEHSSITVKATYREDIIKFQLSFSARKMDLEEKVAQRLDLTDGTFRIKYLDEDGDWVLVTCDEDLNTTLSTLRSLGSSTFKILVN